MTSLGMAEVILIGTFALGIGMVVSLLRLFLGPTSPDRVVAFDAMNTLVVGIMIGLSAFYEQVVLIDIAIVYALLSWVSTLAIAKYIGNTKEKEG
ncbi:MAG: cation:proton antiporter [Candidatus Thermoplasmatota archaeon]|nr:cation:proton antiporter [Candidatus Thermoplasmatota archaeon]